MLAVNFVQNPVFLCDRRNKCSKKNINFCAWEKTLIGIKPDAFERGLADNLEENCIKETGLKKIKEWMGTPTREKMEIQYISHKNKPFFNDWITYLTSGKFKAIVLEGDDAVKKGREFIEKIRAYYAVGKRENLMHASRTTEESKREMDNFFPE